jgi:EAL domain-containing protein (putative c-di-GMP-specific phosphodiesterase class I)
VRIQECFGEPFTLAGQKVFVSASIGIALSESGYSRPDDVLRDADLAMYRAKAQGKARFEVFDTTMHERVVNLMRIEADLRHALDNEELLVHYQPVVHLATGELAWLEALVRWMHSEKGLLSPGDFLPVAEETGLTVPIDRWVMQTACRQVADWRASIPGQETLGVSINMSGRQFRQGDVTEQVARTLAGTGLDPAALRIELTENIVMQDVARASDILAGLRRLGVQLHIDDFGTGFSSLSTLHVFPVDVLKTDRSFVRRMGDTGENAEMVEAIISLAHSLRMAVVAEGVETTDQVARLSLLRCEYAQGFFFSPPLPGPEVEALFFRQPLPSQEIRVG